MRATTLLIILVSACYSAPIEVPTPLATPAIMGFVNEDILQRTVEAFRREKIDYRGCLYAGLMTTPTGPKVVEFNCRFGDPETQVVLMRLKSDIVPLLMGAATGELASVPAPEWDSRVAVTVVMASKGYPESSSRGDVIEGIEEAEGLKAVKVFHAGTAFNHAGQIVTAGGRVLGVTALGDDAEQARKLAYDAVGKIKFNGMQYRTDIAAETVRV